MDRRKQKRLPKYRRAPDKFGVLQMTPRDVEILELVHDYRHVWIDHIQALVPGDPRQLALRVQGMYHHGYLEREVPPSKMRKELGSQKMVCSLALRGVKFLAEHHGVTLQKLGWDRKQNRITEWFVEHQVEISNFHATLALAIDQDPDLELVEWSQSLKHRGSVTVQYKPGRPEYDVTYKVAPDAYFAVEDRGRRSNFFLEMDRGKMLYGRLFEKFEKYWWYLPRGEKDDVESPYFERYENPKDVRVLVVTEPWRSTRPDLVPRVDRMLAELAKLEPRKHKGLHKFWFTTMDQYSLGDPQTVFAPIWRTLSPKPRQLF